MKFFRIFGCILGVAFASLSLTGCASWSPAKTTNPDARGSSANYSLLYELLSKEKNVNKLLMVKGEREEIGTVIQAIAETAREAAEKIEEFAAEDPALVWKQTELPPIEAKTRASIESARGRRLLVDRKLKFEIGLLITQIEALNYGAHMTKVLAVGEHDLRRRAFLESLQQRLTRLHDDVMAIFQSHYRIAPDSGR